MSIYHCSIKIIGRGSGRSAVSAAAYRAGEKLCSIETGLTHDYTHKGGVIMNEIILPDGAPARLLDRETLWNEVQKIEKRSDAQFAREVEVALPTELTREEQIECVRAFIKENFTSKGMIADWALHDKGDGNPHAHILLTVRGINEKEGWQLKQKSVFANGRDENGKPIYDPSKPSYDPKDKENTARYRIPALDENGKQKTRVRQGKGTEYLWERISIPANDWNEHDKCEEWRKSWAEHCNNYLPPELRIDHRSYERQGIDMEPTVHEGVTARKMEASGKTADRCEMNREIKQRNQIRQKIAEQFSELSKIILLKVRELYERITGIFSKEKSRRTDKTAREAGGNGIPSGRTPGGERNAGEDWDRTQEPDQFIRAGAVEGKDGTSGKRRRSGRADAVIEQLKQRELEAKRTDSGIDKTELRLTEADGETEETDKRIDELKRIKGEKENNLNERIRKLMEHRGSGNADGADAGRNQQPEPATQTKGRTDTDSLIREIRSAIRSADAKESAAGKERADREDERRRLDLERERAAERERQAAREQAERDQKKRRSRGQSL